MAVQICNKDVVNAVYVVDKLFSEGKINSEEYATLMPVIDSCVKNEKSDEDC